MCFCVVVCGCVVAWLRGRLAVCVWGPFFFFFCFSFLFFFPSSLSAPASGPGLQLFCSALLSALMALVPAVLAQHPCKRPAAMDSQLRANADRAMRLGLLLAERSLDNLLPAVRQPAPQPISTSVACQTPSPPEGSPATSTPTSITPRPAACRPTRRPAVALRAGRARCHSPPSTSPKSRALPPTLASRPAWAPATSVPNSLSPRLPLPLPAALLPTGRPVLLSGRSTLAAHARVLRPALLLCPVPSFAGRRRGHCLPLQAASQSASPAQLALPEAQPSVQHLLRSLLAPNMALPAGLSISWASPIARLRHSWRQCLLLCPTCRPLWQVLTLVCS